MAKRFVKGGFGGLGDSEREIPLATKRSLKMELHVPFRLNLMLGNVMLTLWNL